MAVARAEETRRLQVASPVGRDARQSVNDHTSTFDRGRVGDREICYRLGPDMVAAMRRAREREESPIGVKVGRAEGRSG